MHHHIQERIVILEEGNQPYPRYPKCDVFVFQWDLNGQHHSTDIFLRPLSPVSYFKYLGRILSASDDNWTSAVRNIRQAQKNLALLMLLLGR